MAETADSAAATGTTPNRQQPPPEGCTGPVGPESLDRTTYALLRGTARWTSARRHASNSVEVRIPRTELEEQQQQQPTLLPTRSPPISPLPDTPFRGER